MGRAWTYSCGGFANGNRDVEEVKSIGSTRLDVTGSDKTTRDLQAPLQSRIVTPDAR